MDDDLVRANDAELIRRLRGLHPSLIDFSTGRIRRLLAALGDPQKKLPPVIHVAGTNGKGSTTAFLRAIGEAGGLSVHCLTSPHLVRFAERIRLAGKLIGEDRLSELVNRTEAANDDQPISFHELVTAIAILGFSETSADLCVIEVGMGGRFDCTNVFDTPAVSVITPVDFDHVETLGPDLSNLAWEKAGVIKASRPCVLAEQQPQALAIIEAEARALGAPLTLLGRDVLVEKREGRLCVSSTSRDLNLPPPALFGPHQFQNAALAVAAYLEFDRTADERALASGLSGAVWPGRFQELKSGPYAIASRACGARLFLDGAHNPRGGRALARTIESLLEIDPRPVAMIVGMFARKDAAGFFAPFAPLRPNVVTVGFDAPTAASPEDLARTAKQSGLKARSAPSIDDAVHEALSAAAGPQHIVLCGGLHFAGEILARTPESWPQ
jgi:dihydrofolate synthase / folylpolyglutamate synthase